MDIFLEGWELDEMYYVCGAIATLSRNEGPTKCGPVSTVKRVAYAHKTD